MSCWMTGVAAGSPSRIALALTATSSGVNPARADDRWIDLEDRRRPADGVLDAVAHIHHALDVVNGVAHFRCPQCQQRRIGRKQFDLHRLRRVGQIANHVLQHLHVFDFQTRLLFFHPGAQFGDDFFAAAVALALQLHRDVAAVRLGHCRQSQLQSSAARCAFDLRDFAQHLLDVADHAIGFLQRTSGGRKIVNDEAAFIHFRQQVGTQQLIAAKRRDHQDHGENGNPPGTIEREAQPAFVELDHSPKAPAECSLFRSHQLFFVAQASVSRLGRLSRHHRGARE